MVRTCKADNYLKIGNWSVFVSLGWRLVYGIIMRWGGRERFPSRCHHDSGIYWSCFSPTLWASRHWVTPRTCLIGRPARGYSVSPPSHLIISVVYLEPARTCKKRRARLEDVDHTGTTVCHCMVCIYYFLFLTAAERWMTMLWADDCHSTLSIPYSYSYIIRTKHRQSVSSWSQHCFRGRASHTIILYDFSLIFL